MDKQREEFEAWFARAMYHKHLKENFWDVWQQAQKVAVPDGFVVVPVEPTKEMYLVGTHELTHIDFRDICDTDSVQVYKAMIKAGEKK